MYKNERTCGERRQGAVLAAVLLLGFSAVASAALALAVANLSWRDTDVLVTRMIQENAAEDAMALSYSWFAGELRAKKADELKASFFAQKMDVPPQVLAPLRETARGADTSAVVFDQDYDAAFDAQAEALNLPRSRRSTISLPAGAEGGDNAYTALRFEIRVTIADEKKPGREMLLRRGLIVLYDEDDRFFDSFEVYVQQKYGRNM